MLFELRWRVVRRMFEEHREGCKACRWSRYCNDGDSLSTYANKLRRMTEEEQGKFFAEVFKPLDVTE